MRNRPTIYMYSIILTFIVFIHAGIVRLFCGKERILRSIDSFIDMVENHPMAEELNKGSDKSRKEVERLLTATYIKPLEFWSKF